MATLTITLPDALKKDAEKAAADDGIPIDAVVHLQLAGVAVGEAHGVETRLFVIARCAPTAAGSVEQVVADEAILKSVTAARCRQRVIAPRRSIVSAVIKERERHAHHGDVTGGNFRAPHAIALRIRAHEHVEMLVFTFQK